MLCNPWDTPKLKRYLLFIRNLNLIWYPAFYLATLTDKLPVHHGLPRSFPGFGDHPSKSKNQCLWSYKNECASQAQKVRGVRTLIIDSALNTGHEVTPSALTHSISEEVEIRNLDWVSHLLFNHRDPQMQ